MVNLIHQLITLLNIALLYYSHCYILHTDICIISCITWLSHDYHMNDQPHSFFLIPVIVMLRDSLFGFEIFLGSFSIFCFVFLFYYLVLVCYILSVLLNLLWFSVLVVMVTSGLYNSVLKINNLLEI